ncbi:MAG: conserved membrane protein of unknown function [Promethearchaeota archaeon]|nr:MAG: conserved membrane protein of unknown function [Candidatus Lokiarchaeota archaeon]
MSEIEENKEIPNKSVNETEENESNSLETQEEGEKNYSVFAYFRSIKPLIFSHHPNCEKFEEHTFRIRGMKFCIGCFIGIPSAIIGVVLIYFLNLIFSFSQEVLLITGIVLMSTFLLSPLKLTKFRPIKFAQKILFNLGAAFIFWWVIYLPNSLFFNLLFGLFVYMAAISVLNLYHSYSIFRTCKKCEYEMDWESCPGFTDIMEYIEENDLPNIYKFKK